MSIDLERYGPILKAFIDQPIPQIVKREFHELMQFDAYVAAYAEKILHSTCTNKDPSFSLDISIEKDIIDRINSEDVSKEILELKVYYFMLKATIEIIGLAIH